MKRTFKTILCTAAVVLVAASCTKSAEPATPAEEGKGTIDICVNGLMGEYTQQDGVKSSLVNNVRVAWAAGDVVYVFDGSNYLGKLSAALDKKADGLTDEDRYAKLGGTISAPSTTPCVLSLVHSSLMTEPETGVAVSELSIDMSAQSTATAPFVAYATLEYTGTTIKNAVVPFQFATSVIKVNCTGLKPGTAITSATLSNVNTACKLTLSGDKAPVIAGGTNGTITRTGDSYFADGKINDEGEAVFQIAVPVLETATGERVLTVAQGSDEVKDKKFTTKSLVAATSVNTVCQLVGLPTGALKGEFSVSATKKVYFSQGNLVATIDATGAPKAWKFAANQYDCLGEGGANKTIGATDGDVDLFGWSTDAASNNWGIHTKTSETDGFTTGNFKDWGKAYCEKNSITPDNTWCTLSTVEWQYLFAWNSTLNHGEGGVDKKLPRSRLFKYGVTVCGKANCVVLLPDNWEWDESTVGTGWQTGGYPETATESNPVTWQTMQAAGAVCLPAAGCRYSPNVWDFGDFGYYWSNTAYDDYGDYAYYVNFDGSRVGPGNHDWRYVGCSVRLVTESK